MVNIKCADVTFRAFPIEFQKLLQSLVTFILSAIAGVRVGLREEIICRSNEVSHSLHFLCQIHMYVANECILITSLCKIKDAGSY